MTEEFVLILIIGFLAQAVDGALGAALTACVEVKFQPVEDRFSALQHSLILPLVMGRERLRENVGWLFPNEARFVFSAAGAYHHVRPCLLRTE